MALKRVRFTVEEESCEHKLGQQQRRLETALRLQRTSGQLLEQTLQECERERARLRTEVGQLRVSAASVQLMLEQAQEQAQLLRNQLEQTWARHRQVTAACAVREGKLRQDVASKDDQLRKCRSELLDCCGELARFREADRRRSSGGSHKAQQQQQEQEQQQQQQLEQEQQPQQQDEEQQQQQQLPPQAADLLAGGAAEVGAGSGADQQQQPQAVEPAAAGDSSAAVAGAQVLADLPNAGQGGPVAPRPEQPRWEPSSDPSAA